MEDHEIVAGLLARDEAALAAVQERYAPLLRRMAGRFLSDPRDAEECVSEAFYKLWNAVPPQEPENLSAFLVSLLRASAIDRLRHLEAQKRGGTQYAASLEELGDVVSGPEETGDLADLTEAIGRWLGSAAPETRAVFIRRYYLAQSLREIAEATGFTQGRVKSLLFRARGKLKAFLEKEGYDL